MGATATRSSCSLAMLATATILCLRYDALALADGAAESIPATATDAPARDAAAPAVAATTAPPSAFVSLTDVDPSIRLDIRYAGPNNFLGRPVPGYDDALCLITVPTAAALARAQAKLRTRGLSLRVYDCYRPQRAVDAFVAWVRAPVDDGPGAAVRKATYLPRVERSDLLREGYIAERSGHSRGSTVDLTIEPVTGDGATIATADPAARAGGAAATLDAARDCASPAHLQDGSVEMATAFDCFDPLAHTANPAVTDAPRTNRDLLVATMHEAGLRNLPEEWWHFTLEGEPFPETAFDFPVARGSLGEPR